VVIAALSPPGKAVFHSVREAVGIEHAEPALFSLPAPGRLLVVSGGHGGVWLVKSNGFMRKLGSYSDAEWSPHGLYVIATERNELVAFDPDGGVRWKLARRAPSSPRWEGTMTDTRIAYLAASGLRVVAGDGTGDHLLDAHADHVPAAWDPSRLHTLAYSSGGAIVLRRADGPVVWRAAVEIAPSALEWSSDGRYLAVVSPRQVVVLDRRGRAERTISMLGAQLRQASFEPGTHQLAVVVRFAGRSEIRMVDVDHPGHARLLFAGPGTFGDVEWSPTDNWLLVNWPDANQWVFIKGKQVHAVANIRQQFARADGAGSLLELSGRWCCSK
jgi:hypothetical protein